MRTIKTVLVLSIISLFIFAFNQSDELCNAKNYLGTRIKMTGYIKSENVTDWAGMWLRIDSKTPSESLGFDNMQDRPITGNSDWTKCEIVMAFSPNKDSTKVVILADSAGKFNVSADQLKEWENDYVYIKPFGPYESQRPKKHGIL